MNYDDPQFVDYSTLYPPPPPMPSALCQYTDPEIFFPISAREEVDRYRLSGPRYGKSVKPLEVAKSICKKCDHLIECRDFAVREAVPFGVWGATTPVERRLLRKLVYVEVSVEVTYRGEAAG